MDVGSGALFTKRRDFTLPGTFGLDWVRNYATDCEEDGWLGRGWTVPYFLRLERRDDGLLLTDEVGRPLLFPLPGGDLQPGQALVALGANMELRRLPTHFEILHWHIASDDIERLCFLPSADGHMPLAWMENLAGHRISVQYDAAGRPVRVTQELEQRVLALSFDARNLITAVHFIGDDGEPELMVRYEYDTARRLVSSMDVLGHECRYAYDEHHRLVLEGNPLGSSFRFRYDASGRCVYTAGEGGYLARKLEYFSAPHMTRVTDSLGNVAQYFLNPAGQVIQEISPLGTTTTTEFDAHGRVVKIVKPGGAAVSYEYDERGNRKAYFDEAGAQSALEHNELHLITEFTDPAGSKWVYDYDTRGNLLALTNPLGARLECDRDARGLVIEARRPGGLVTRRRYGQRMRGIEVSDQFSVLTRVDVDARGSQTAVYGAKGLVRRLRNDVLGRPVEVVDGQGRTTRLVYNANNDLVERVLPGNVWERWEYDNIGRLVAHENAAGRMLLEYDTEDHLLAVVNRAGERLTRSYDADGRMVTQTFFDGRGERYEYDTLGRRVRDIKSDGRAVDYQFDASGALVARSSSDGLHEEFTRDANGRLVMAKNADAEVLFERDALGRVIAEVQNGRRVETRFDADNNCVRRRLVGIEGSDLAMRYDPRGRLTGLADLNGICQDLSWGTGDELLERRFPGGAVERFAYDDAGRLAAHAFVSPLSGTVFDQRYAYDDRDNLQAREDSRNGRSSFSYDALSRLTAVSQGGKPTESYLHDAVGTLLQTHRGARIVGPGARVLGDGARQYQYGANGCVDAIDTAQGRYALRHNVDGKLIGVTLPDGGEVRYGYDPLGRRVFKEVGGERTDFVWQSCDLAAELRAGAALVMHFHQNQTPIAQWSGAVRQVPVVNQIGLPEALLNERGEPLWHARFDAYGNVLAEHGPQAGQGGSPFRFRGQYFDRETGLHYNFHRHYDPQLAGYVSPDPIGLSGGANFYAYPRNPFLWDDPFGLTCSNQHKGQMGEAEMDAHFAAQGYTKLGAHHGPQGIDGVYHNPAGNPPYIIGEAKYGSSRLGSTLSGRQMSDNWIDSPIGQANPAAGTPGRLEAAVGPVHAANIQASATANPGSVQRQVFQLPAPGTPGTGSVTKTANYTPSSGGRTFP